MARTVEGFTETYCTMYGQETNFIALEDSQEQTTPKCYECSVCILQANLNGQPVAFTPLLNARYVLDTKSPIEALFLAPNPLLFPRFLSRAPPV